MVSLSTMIEELG